MGSRSNRVTDSELLPETLESSSGLSQWIQAENLVARRWLLGNIGPIAGAADGLAIASPSRGGADAVPQYYVSPDAPVCPSPYRIVLVHMDPRLGARHVDSSSFLPSRVSPPAVVGPGCTYLGRVYTSGDQQLRATAGTPLSGVCRESSGSADGQIRIR